MVTHQSVAFTFLQVEEGKYYLEDHTSQVLLNFSQASLLTDGFVTENSVVLVEGEAIDGVLHVHHMGEFVCVLYLSLKIVIVHCMHCSDHCYST